MIINNDTSKNKDSSDYHLMIRIGNYQKHIFFNKGRVIKTRFVLKFVRSFAFQNSHACVVHLLVHLSGAALYV